MEERMGEGQSHKEEET